MHTWGFRCFSEYSQNFVHSRYLFLNDRCLIENQLAVFELLLEDRLGPKEVCTQYAGILRNQIIQVGLHIFYALLQGASSSFPGIISFVLMIL